MFVDSLQFFWIMPRIVQAIRFNRSRRTTRIAVLAARGASVGGVTVFERPLITGPFHYEAIIALFVVMPAICLATVISHHRVPCRLAMSSIHLELALLWMIFAK